MNQKTMPTIEVNKTTGVAEIQVPVKKQPVLRIELQLNKALFDKKLMRAIIKEIGKKEDQMFIKKIEEAWRNNQAAVLQHSDVSKIEYCDGDTGMMTILFNIKKFINEAVLNELEQEGEEHLKALKKKIRFYKIKHQ